MIIDVTIVRLHPFFRLQATFKIERARLGRLRRP